LWAAFFFRAVVSRPLSFSQGTTTDHQADPRQRSPSGVREKMNTGQTPGVAPGASLDAWPQHAPSFCGASGPRAAENPCRANCNAFSSPVFAVSHCSKRNRSPETAEAPGAWSRTSIQPGPEPLLGSRPTRAQTENPARDLPASWPRHGFSRSIAVATSRPFPPIRSGLARQKTWGLP